jgi:hypothetical protein
MRFLRGNPKKEKTRERPVQISLYGDCLTVQKDYQAIKLPLSHTHSLLASLSEFKQEIKKEQENPRRLHKL